MKRTRYQYGRVEPSPRANRPNVWVYRWREQNPDGKSSRKSAIVGSVTEYSTQAHALRAAEYMRLVANPDNPNGRLISFGALVERYVRGTRMFGCDLKTGGESGIRYSRNLHLSSYDNSTMLSQVFKRSTAIRRNSFGYRPTRLFATCSAFPCKVCLIRVSKVKGSVHSKLTNEISKEPTS